MSWSWLRPAAVVEMIVLLAASQVLYAVFPYRRRAYAAVLVATAAGLAVGLLWDALGLPSARLGEAPVLPGLVFAAAAQVLVDRRPGGVRPPAALPADPPAPGGAPPRT